MEPRYLDCAALEESLLYKTLQNNLNIEEIHHVMRWVKEFISFDRELRQIDFQECRWIAYRSKMNYPNSTWESMGGTFYKAPKEAFTHLMKARTRGGYNHGQFQSAFDKAAEHTLRAAMVFIDGQKTLPNTLDARFGTRNDMGYRYGNGVEFEVEIAFAKVIDGPRLQKLRKKQRIMGGRKIILAALAWSKEVSRFLYRNREKFTLVVPVLVNERIRFAKVF